MKILAQIGIEQKYGAVFGIAAFVLSLLTGLVSGVSFTVTIIRSVIMMPVFFAVGYGIITVLKNFVPEIYEALSEIRAKSVAAESENQVNIMTSDLGSDSMARPDMETDYSQNAGEEFTELTPKDFDRYKTSDDAGLEAGLNSPGGKLGKHVIVQEQFNSYEPKIMAQAIRTMMSKDKD